jgi:hypothetical protein
LGNYQTPNFEGGLKVRDPKLENLSLGGKILWKLYTNRRHPVSQILRKKYLKWGFLEKPTGRNTHKGTLIWNLYHPRLDYFQKNLYHIPGNGEK